MKDLYKNIFFVMLTCIFLSNPVHALESIQVEALTPFNSLKPVQKMKVMALETKTFKNGVTIKDGTIIYGDIIDVKQPTRGKRNASFKFKPTTCTYLGKTTKISDPNFIAKYSEGKPLDKGAIATSAATTAGGFIFHIPFLSEGVSLVKGFVKNNENNRIKSGVVQVYKDSPLSYVEEGKDIVIQENTTFFLKFKSTNEEDLEKAIEEAENNSEKNIPITNETTPVELKPISRVVEDIDPNAIYLEVEKAESTKKE